MSKFIKYFVGIVLLISLTGCPEEFPEKDGTRHGRWKNGQTYVSPLYFGIRQGNRIERIGYNHWKFQHATQNWFAHERGFARSGLFGYADYFMDYDYFNNGIYSYSGYYNPYSIWGF